MSWPKNFSWQMFGVGSAAVVVLQIFYGYTIEKFEFLGTSSTLKFITLHLQVQCNVLINTTQP
jgi:hypothetical protein